MVVAQLPDIEVKLSNHLPWVQQMLLYTVVVRTDSNTQISKFTMPDIDNGRIEIVGQPVIQEEISTKGKVIKTEYYFLVTPISEGNLEIGAATVVLRSHYNQYVPSWGKQRNWQPHVGQANNSFTLHSKVISIPVAAPTLQEKYWLPLLELRLQGDMERQQLFQEGEPFTWTITFDAMGIHKDSLPDLSTLLESDSFKIYLESVNKYEDINEANKTVYARRTEHYTLVPKKSGTLSLPILEIVWWDVLTASKKIARLNSQSVFILPSEDQSKPLPDSVSKQSTTTNIGYYIGLVIAAAGMFFLGLWIGAGKPGSDKMIKQWYNMGEFVYRQIIKWKQPLVDYITAVKMYWKRVFPSGAAPLWWRFFNYYEQRLPVLLQIFWIRYHVQQSDTVDQLYHAVGKLALLDVTLSEQSPLIVIANKLSDSYLFLSKQILYPLLQTLEKTTFTNKKLNIPKWKQQFLLLFSYHHFYINKKNYSVASQDKDNHKLPPLNYQ